MNSSVLSMFTILCNLCQKRVYFLKKVHAYLSAYFYFFRFFDYENVFFFFAKTFFFFFRTIFFGRFYPPQKVFILISDKYHGALNLISDKWHELLHKNKDNDPTLKNTILLQIHRNFLDLIFFKIHLAKQQIPACLIFHPYVLKNFVNFHVTENE